MTQSSWHGHPGRPGSLTTERTERTHRILNHERAHRSIATQAGHVTGRLRGDYFVLHHAHAKGLVALTGDPPTGFVTVARSFANICDITAYNDAGRTNGAVVAITAARGLTGDDAWRDLFPDKVLRFLANRFSVPLPIHDPNTLGNRAAVIDALHKASGIVPVQPAAIQTWDRFTEFITDSINFTIIPDEHTCERIFFVLTAQEKIPGTHTQCTVGFVSNTMIKNFARFAGDAAGATIHRSHNRA